MSLNPNSFFKSKINCAASLLPDTIKQYILNLVKYSSSSGSKFLDNILHASSTFDCERYWSNRYFVSLVFKFIIWFLIKYSSIKIKSEFFISHSDRKSKNSFSDIFISGKYAFVNKTILIISVASSERLTLLSLEIIFFNWSPLEFFHKLISKS